MTEKLYMLDTKWRLGEIEEVEVIKETEKTYTIKRTRWGTNLVRKSEMRVWGYCFCKSFGEAVEKTKELLKSRILQYTNKIENLKADIEKYNAMLAEFEKDGDTECQTINSDWWSCCRKQTKKYKSTYLKMTIWIGFQN